MCGDHWSIKGIGGSGATLLACFTGSRGAAGIIGFCGAGAGWAFSIVAPPSLQGHAAWHCGQTHSTLHFFTEEHLVAG
jgi:hypothetical protein